jgi:hypothetical protein
MKSLKILSAMLLVCAVILACASAPNPQQVDQAATIVAQTLQAVTPAPSAGLLPHSLYFLNNDGKGIVQVFRLDADGKTLHQITFEPANVDVYDVSTKDGSVAYVSGNKLLMVDVHGAGGASCWMAERSTITTAGRMKSARPPFHQTVRPWPSHTMG